MTLITEDKLKELRRLDALGQDPIVDQSLKDMFDTLEALWRVARCLEMSRGQWIHSVNAKECLKALSALQEK